jgi:hypothetical protein
LFVVVVVVISDVVTIVLERSVQSFAELANRANKAISGSDDDQRVTTTPDWKERPRTTTTISPERLNGCLKRE